GASCRAAFLCVRAAVAGSSRDRAGGNGDRGFRLSRVARRKAADCGDAASRGHLVTIVEAHELTRVFPMNAGPVVAVRDASLRVDRGDYIAIGGPSGCGKSTLLHLLGCVDTPTSG